MNCPTCGRELKPSQTELTYNLGGFATVTIHKVPSKACSKKHHIIDGPLGIDLGEEVSNLHVGLANISHRIKQGRYK